jgi:hypothetical protein
MKRILFTMFTILLLAVSLMADTPAVGYWLVERSSLTNAVSSAGGLEKVQESVLDQLADCHGRFTGNCDLWLHAGTVQFRLKATDDGKAIDYTLRLSRPQVKVQPKASEGRLDVEKVFTAKDGWEKESVVLVMKRQNLKK